MSQAVTASGGTRSYRKEAVVAVAAVGIAIIVWNLRDKIADFWFSLGFSCSSNSASVSEKSSVEASKSAPEALESPIQKSGDVAPESVNGKSSSEKTEDAGVSQNQPKEVVGNIAPESTENAATTSTYVGLPKADPTTVSAPIPTPNWPGATPR